MAGSGTAHLRGGEEALLQVRHLRVEFDVSGGVVQAVSDLSFDAIKGETLGLVGESGCGKSSVGRAIMQLPPPTGGEVLLNGVDLTRLKGEALRQQRTRLQMIFQDPIASLNPRRRVSDIVAEGLSIWGMNSEQRRARVAEVMTAVGLDPELTGDRRPHQFSGGQCQRICIARSLALNPAMLICDEPVSALDVSVQAQILNLLEDMKQRYGLTMVFIGQDLSVVKNISDRVAVMYLGKLCEIGPADQLYRAPAHPYTRALLDAIPEPDPQQVVPVTSLSGELPSPMDPPSGCRFRTRCPRAGASCATSEPQVREVAQGQFVACHFPLARAE